MATPKESIVTMRELAAKLRLSTMTVSRALRNAAGVSAKTRQRVADAAQQLNYRPDPSLAALNKYRHGRRKAVFSEKLAFVTNFPTADGWRYSLTFVHYFEGARKRALQLGYDIEPFWLGAPGLSSQRASEILRGRGIRGLIVGPLPQGQTSLNLNWDYFAAVAVGRSLEAPKLTTVSINHYQAMELACQEVMRRGYRRIGFAVTAGDEARTAGAPRASFQLNQERFEGQKLPVLLLPKFSADAICAWAREHRPDVVLSSEQTHYELLQEGLGRRAREISFVHLNVDPASDFAGIDQGNISVGEHASSRLHLKLIQREAGVPARRDMILINGSWKEGRGAWSVHSPVNC